MEARDVAAVPRPPGRARGDGPGARRPGLRRAAFLLAFAALCLLGRATVPPEAPLAMVWPASGAALLWLLGSWGRPRALLLDGALLCATAAAVLTATGAAPAVAAALALSNLVLALAACAVLRRLLPGAGRPLTRVRDLGALVSASAAGALASALVGPVALGLLAEQDVGRFLQDLAAWVLRLTVSTSVVAAAGLQLLGEGRWPRWPGLPRSRRAVEVALLVVAMVVGYHQLFGAADPLPLSFVLLPLSVWTGMRFSTTATALHVLAVGAVVVVLTQAGRGTFALRFASDQVAVAHAYIAVVGFVSLALALHRDERVALIARMREAQQRASGQAELLDAVFTSIGDGVTVVDAEGRFLLQNPRARELVGQPLDGVDPDGWSERYGFSRLDGSPLPSRELPLARALAGEEVPAADVLVRGPGEPAGRVLSVSARPLPGPPGEHGAVAAFRDVTEERRAADEVVRARDLLAAVLEAATEQAVVATDAQHRITLFNEGARRMLGHTPAEVLGRTSLLWLDPAEVAHRAGELGVEPGPSVLVQAAVQGHPETRRWTFVRRDGRRLQARLSVSAMRDEDGTVTGFIGVATDVTEQHRAEQALAESEQRFRLAFETAPLGMALVSLGSGDAGRLVQVNDALAHLVGRPARELPALVLTDLVDAEDAAAVGDLLARLAAGQVSSVRTECRFRRPDGGVVWGLCAGSTVPHTAAGEARLVLLVEDVTARKAAQATLERQALHDALTGLPNRALLADRLEHALLETARSGLRAGLVYLDLDGFKAVNDTAGHAAGDELLVQVAVRLQACVRPGDTVARLGGDEFAIVCPGIGSSRALHAVAARALDVIRRPVELRAGSYAVSASVGATLADGAASVEEVLRAADETMYAAKRAGKDQVLLLDAGQGSQAVPTTRLLRQLEAALTAGELVLHGQPVVELATERVVAVEVLLRWQHPERGLLPPVEFLPIAESSPLVVDVGRRVLAEACRMATTWSELLGAAAPPVHVNVSGRHLESGRLAGDVLEALQRYHLPPDRLVLELTEAHVPLLAEAFRHDVEFLRRRGVRLAVDDVGTGHCSLVRLSELPVDVLKVDAAFVAGMGADPRCDAVVRATIGIGRALGPLVVAEGVQAPQQAEALRRYGCDGAQGHLYSPPRPEADLLALLRAWPEGGRERTVHLPAEGPRQQRGPGPAAGG